MCGAVGGAVMGLGLVSGRTSPRQAVERNYALVRRLVHSFVARCGTTKCTDRLGCDLGTPEGQQIFRDNHLVERCNGYTEGATEIALSLIAQRREDQPP